MVSGEMKHAAFTDDAAMDAVSIVSTVSAVSTVVPRLCWRSIAADP